MNMNSSAVLGGESVGSLADVSDESRVLAPLA
jgi:hypothetical protein